MVGMEAEIHGRPTAVWPVSSCHSRKPRAARSRKRPKSYPEARLKNIWSRNSCLFGFVVGNSSKRAFATAISAVSVEKG